MLVDLAEIEQLASSDAYELVARLDNDVAALLLSVVSFLNSPRYWVYNGNQPNATQYDVIDELVGRTNYQLMTPVECDPVIIGELKLMSFKDNADAPDNWLLCDGQIVSALDYPDLGNVANVTIAGGAPSFKLPDYRGYFLRGRPAGGSVTTEIGEDTVSLSASQNGRHSHVIDDFSSAIVAVGAGAPITVTIPGAFPFNTNQSGNGSPHNNIPSAYHTDIWMVARYP